MILEELYEQKLRRGDIVTVTVTYRSLGPSTWAGPVINVKPIVLFPYSGNSGYEALVIDETKSANYQIVYNPFYIRWLLFIIAILDTLKAGPK